MCLELGFEVSLLLGSRLLSNRGSWSLGGWCGFDSSLLSNSNLRGWSGFGGNLLDSLCGTASIWGSAYCRWAISEVFDVGFIVFEFTFTKVFKSRFVIVFEFTFTKIFKSGFVIVFEFAFAEFF